MKTIHAATSIRAALLGLAVLLPAVTAPAENPRPAKTGIAKVLVLKNGRTVEGIINRNSAGYVVDKPTGSMVVAEDLVKFAAADRTEAHAKMRGTFDLKQADGHVKLAGWCLTNGYHDQAGTELREALQIEPNNEDARRMLTRLEDIVNPDQPRHRLVDSPAPKTVDGFEKPEARSIGNLSRDEAFQFVAKVQPILMNKCATAGCHGPAETNKLRLERVAAGTNTHRLYTDRNLAAVLQQINGKNAEQSPLLVKPQGAHGKHGRAIFSGPGSAEQLETLRNWVTAVADEQTKDRRADASQTKLLKERSPVTSSPSIASGEGKQNGTGSSDGDVLTKALHDQRPDAFNPQEFNARNHGAGRKRNALNGK